MQDHETQVDAAFYSVTFMSFRSAAMVGYTLISNPSHFSLNFHLTSY